MGQYPAVEAMFQVVVEGQQGLEAEAAASQPPEENPGPLEHGQCGAGLVAGYCLSHLFTKFVDQGAEAKHLEFCGVFAAEGVYLTSELAECHCFTTPDIFALISRL